MICAFSTRCCRHVTELTKRTRSIALRRRLDQESRLSPIELRFTMRIICNMFARPSKSRSRSVSRQIMTLPKSICSKRQVEFSLQDLCVAPRRILGGKDLNSRHTPFQPPPSTAKQFKNAQGGDAWSPPFSRPTYRRQSRRSSIGIRSSPVEAVVVKDFEEEIEYMPPGPAGCLSKCVLTLIQKSRTSQRITNLLIGKYLVL